MPGRLLVFPAAELPLRALGKGATVVHINPVPFEISADEHFLQGPATQMMQSLISAAFE
ncbi:cobalamin biosynthetic protein [Pseudomonas sp. 39167]|uniref:cobalamin biosynthetic protein n=1 Tax=Pseudomonas sp. 39167 TaxID=2967215 RepID=UPI002364068F|nr:cobalamin biosynthetic protein [Pseudomonas sp. 39167]MDD2031598.1 cobalamin biosynthetic protein [Pseudomonas sp. 39167]